MRNLPLKQILWQPNGRRLGDRTPQGCQGRPESHEKLFVPRSGNAKNSGPTPQDAPTMTRAFTLKVVALVGAAHEASSKSLHVHESRYLEHNMRTSIQTFIAHNSVVNEIFDS